MNTRRTLSRVAEDSFIAQMHCFFLHFSFLITTHSLTATPENALFKIIIQQKIRLKIDTQ